MEGSTGSAQSSCNEMISVGESTFQELKALFAGVVGPRVVKGLEAKQIPA